MAVTDLDEETKITFRCTERFKRMAGMRANQRGMDVSEYIRSLVNEDLEKVEFPEPE